jgi:hypothetical protein
MIKLLKESFWLLSGLFALVIILSSCDKNETDFHQTSIEGVAFDAISFENLSGANISLQLSPGSSTSSILQETTLNENGVYFLKNISVGQYKIVFTRPGYKTMFSSNIDIDPSKGNPFVAFLPVKESIATPVGGITGVVRTTDGREIPNASIAISAQNEEISNGYFSSVSSNENGQYYIGAIPLQSTAEFKVRCISDGYKMDIIQNVNISQNEMVVIDFVMFEAPPPTQIFHEDFEDPLTNWEMEGLWNVHKNETIFNEMNPEYVILAPNDYSEGAMPDSYKGISSIWYGNKETGNYLGEQSPYDYELSGGTSVAKNRGTLISPIINLSNLEEASFNFWSWFEIESVNPNQTGYDLMEIHVIKSSGVPEQLGKLNPYTDPIIPDRKPIPFTSGGFNQLPAWKYHEFDLTEYVGSSIRLQFVFDTRDGLYNGFRGWIIDEITVTDKGLGQTKSGKYVPLPLSKKRPEYE